jgi:antitoxin (DNA-binding transcriptional repressor) of toxin-antitoxin stability system
VPAVGAWGAAAGSFLSVDPALGYYSPINNLVHPMDGTVSIEDAKERLDDLMARAARGENVRIAGPAFGTVRLVPEASSARPKRQIGQWKGIVTVPARLMEPLTEDELRWLSGEDSP